jgi:hypothetical protein
MDYMTLRMQQILFKLGTEIHDLKEKDRLYHQFIPRALKSPFAREIRAKEEKYNAVLQKYNELTSGK